MAWQVMDRSAPRCDRKWTDVLDGKSAVIRADGFTRNGEEYSGVWIDPEHLGLILVAPDLLEAASELIHARDNSPGDDLGAEASARAWIKLREAVAKANQTPPAHLSTRLVR
jgi:hypothetical protein